jgi:hypothetical protein
MRLKAVEEDFVNLDYLIIDVGEMNVESNVKKHLKSKYSNIFNDRKDLELTQIAELKEVSVADRNNMVVYEVKTKSEYGEIYINLCIVYSQRKGTVNHYQDDEIGNIYKDIYLTLNNHNIKELEDVTLKGNNFQILEQYITSLSEKENLEQVFQYEYIDIVGSVSHNITTKSIVVYEKEGQLYRFNLNLYIDLSQH